MLHAYTTIIKQEGIARGLYGGITPAMLGSGNINVLTLEFPCVKTIHYYDKIIFFLVPATTIYFGTYEFVKRNIIGIGIPNTVVHLIAGEKITVKFFKFFYLQFYCQ